MPEEIFNEIKLIVETHYPNECGGVLVGYIEEETAVIERMLLPNKITSTPVLFRRLAKGLNTILSKLFLRTNGKTNYLGEWHSHPNASPIPSDMDRNTMVKIAANKNIKIETPLLLIVAYNRTFFDEKFYVLYNNKLISYDQQD